MNRPLIHKNCHNEFQDIDIALNVERIPHVAASLFLVKKIKAAILRTKKLTQNTLSMKYGMMTVSSTKSTSCLFYVYSFPPLATKIA